MDPDELRGIELFEGLDDDQLSRLLADSVVVPFAYGDTLFSEGEPAVIWWVLLEGTVDLVRHLGGEDTVVARFDLPGRWSGGFRAWDESGVYLATGRATSAGRVLRVPSATLFDLVASLPLASHLIDGLFHTARNVEAAARQRESLVALGRISAGLAHELNNPASAATRAVDSLQQACTAMLGSLSQLAAGSLTATQFTALDQLRLEVVPRAVPPAPLVLARAEDALVEWLEQRGVTDAWSVAPVLAAAGVDLPWCERVADALTPATLGPGLAWVASTLTASMLLAEIKESTGRVSDLVAAVRSYSQMDRASRQRMDVTEGLESTLAILGHKLRDVTVVRDYAADVPEIEAYAGELNQVWTNLVDNAVDAMSGQGTLHLRTRVEDDQVVVEVVDSGAGMSDDVARRAFEPFFTTKDVGKGTGLGLDIAHRIVTDRHGGTITIDSRPGETVIRVSLPARTH